MTAVATPETPETTSETATRMPRRTRSAAWLRERGMGATILVSAISAAFGVLLLSATGYIAAWVDADPYLGGGETVTVVVDEDLLVRTLAAVTDRRADLGDRTRT